MIARLIYVLCAGTSLTCALLLLRAYRTSGFRLLFWSAVCFALLTLNNVLLFVDVVIVPDVDLSLWRKLTAFVAVATLMFSMIWNTE